MTGPVQDPAGLLRGLFDAAVAAADPAGALPNLLPAPLDPQRGRTVVVGAGKASARMAQVLEAHWPGPLEGLVVSAYGHAAACTQIEIVEAAHPLPDAAGVAAAQRILNLMGELGPDDLAICLLSGGGSALLTLPANGLTLDDKRTVNRALLKSGAPIDAINAVRRHLSAVKGGRLAAAAYPAASILAGGNIRVGLEDNIYLSRGVFATNAQLVERAATITTNMGASLIGPDEVRQKLGLVKQLPQPR